MIVICTKCQAKFRVADEKIGPRGAKVRCSKCHTVFLVHPVLGTMPVTDGDARHVPSGATPVPPTTGSWPPAPPAPPAAPPQQRLFGGIDPFAPPPPTHDPFAPAAGDPFARPAPPADPFAGRDPFAAPPPAASPPPLPEPPADDPFAAKAAPRASLVTDLSDLLGPPAAAPPALPRPPPVPAPPPGAGAPAAPPPEPAAPPEPAPPPGEDPFAAARAAHTAPEEDPFGLTGPTEGAAADGGAGPPLADPFASEDPFAAIVAAPPAAPPEPDLVDLTGSAPAVRAAAPATAADALDVGGLALEDRLTPPPARIAAPGPAPLLDQTLETAAPEPAGASPADPFAALLGAAPAAGEPFDRGAFDFGAQAGGEVETAAPADQTPAPDAAPPAPAVAPRPPAPARPAAVPAVAAAPDVQERLAATRASRLRMVAVNAVALVALLAVALALWVVWRTDGPFEAASLRPSAILAALRHGGGGGPWSAQDVRSGVYDRARGAPLLFVRGRVLSRAPAAVPSVKVAVQVVRGGQVLARGEALAGAVATEEELYLAADDAAIAAATAAARARAPAAIRPGDAVPFLVAIGDAPPDLEGASLRIEVVPAGGGAP